MALALLFAALLAGCADPPCPIPPPASTPSVAAIPASTATVAVGETVRGSLDDTDYFRIRGEENRVYDLSVVPGTLADPIVVLYASDLSRMMEGRGRADTDAVRFVWPGHPGDYYVAVEGGDGGSYTLTLVPFAEDHGDDMPFASEVTLGEPVRGSMGYSFDYDYFRFEAEAGQLYRIEVATGDEGCWNMWLKDSDREILAVDRFSRDRGVIVWEAPSSGDHYVDVANVPSSHGCDSWEGEYTLTVAPTSRPSEDVHGNGLRSAAYVRVGEPVAAGLEYAGDSDYFRFKAVKGCIYRMDVALRTLDSYGYAVSLYGSGGDEIEWSQSTSGYAWEAPASGEYYVTVASPRGETGSYALTVTAIDDDHGEGLASATEIALGETIGGYTQYNGDRDYFRFRAVKGRFYRIDTTLPEPSSFRRVVLQLQDSAGDDVELWGKTWEAPRTGDFYVRMDTPYFMGPYTLSVTRVPVPGADDHGNYRTAATAIVVGEDVSGYANYEGDVDYFRFTAEKDQPYRIQVESRDMDHWGTYLYDSDGGNPWLGPHITTDGSRSWFTWQPPGQGVYYISVSGWDRTGAYTLTVVPVIDDDGDSATSATALAAGKSVDGRIDYQGDIDYFRFRAEGGRIYRMEIYPDSYAKEVPRQGESAGSFTISLYDSVSHGLGVGWDRVNISCDDCGDESGRPTRRPIVWEAPSSGYYYVAVEATLTADVGGYKLAIDRCAE